MPPDRILLIVLGLLLVSCGGDGETPANASQQGLRSVSVRLPIPVVDAAFAPYYLAQDLGLFDKYNLRVKIEGGSPELGPVRMVDSGVDEFGVLGGPELLMSGRAAGAAVKAIGLLHRDANFPVIISLKDSGITTPDDLQNKRIGFFIGHISTDVLRAFLRKEGVEYDEIDVGFNYGPLLSGDLDAEWAFRTTACLTLPAKGYDLNVINPADYGIVSQGHIIVTHERLLAEKPKLVEAFMSAVLEAIEYSLEHPEEAVEATLKRDESLDRQVAEQQIAIYNATIRKNAALGLMDIDVMKQVAKRQQELGVLRASFDVEPAFDNRFVKAFQDRRQQDRAAGD